MNEIKKKIKRSIVIYSKTSLSEEKESQCNFLNFRNHLSCSRRQVSFDFLLVVVFKCRFPRIANKEAGIYCNFGLFFKFTCNLFGGPESFCGYFSGVQK